MDQRADVALMVPTTEERRPAEIEPSGKLAVFGRKLGEHRGFGRVVAEVGKRRSDRPLLEPGPLLFGDVFEYVAETSWRWTSRRGRFDDDHPDVLFSDEVRDLGAHRVEPLGRCGLSP